MATAFLRMLITTPQLSNVATAEVQLKGSHAHRCEHVKHHLHCRAFRGYRASALNAAKAFWDLNAGCHGSWLMATPASHLRIFTLALCSGLLSVRPEPPQTP